MAKKTLVNAETDISVTNFINAVEHEQRRADSKELLEIMKTLTKQEPKMWGRSIIGFGKYKYQRKNGDEFEWFNVGFSPAKAHMSIYFMFDLTKEELLEELGPHKKGKGCLYVKKLEDINLSVLKKMIKKSDKWKRS